MTILFKKSCLSLVVLSALIKILQANENESNIETRQGRVTGRIVKLYSGYKSEPIICLDEGFKADPRDCSMFYRCVKASNQGKYNIFRYQCGPGSIYDPENEVCNHPRNTKRAECGGLIPTHDGNDENEIEGNELPSPMSTKMPVYNLNLANILTTSTLTPHQISQTSTKTSYPTITTAIYGGSTAAYPWLDSKNESNQLLLQSTSDSSFPCVNDGFIGDHENCKKFYRCVRNFHGGFTRHEFLCSDSTIWDENIQSCNHAWAARNSRCGRNNENSHKVNQSPYGQQFNNGSKISDKYNNIKQYEIENDYKINHNNNHDERNQTLAINSQPIIAQPENEINDVNEETLYFNNQYENIQKQTTTAHSTEKPNQNKQTQNSDTGKPVNCLQNGFMGDPNDCSKFYRCVDNGDGKFTKYDFSCSQGTVWDSEAEACNHAWAVKQCGGIFTTSGLPVITSAPLKPTKSSTLSGSSVLTHKTTTTKYSTSVTTNSLNNDNNDSGYLNSIQEIQKETSTPTTVSLISSTTAAYISLSTPTMKPNENINNGPQQPETQKKLCQVDGFMGDKDDCKKFYRCVDDGNGGFTQYEFVCGDGTVWDSSIEVCNYAEAVKTCGGNKEQSGKNPMDNSNKQTTENVQSQGTTSNPSSQVNIHNEYTTESHNSVSTASSTSSHSTTGSTTTVMTSECNGSGFIGDKNDCKKFYRCVENGNGGYERFEFYCSDGTLWDAEVQACNHAWAVSDCRNVVHQEPINNVSETILNQNGNSVEESENSYITENSLTPDNISSTNIQNFTSTTAAGRNPMDNSNKQTTENVQSQGTTSNPSSQVNIHNEYTTESYNSVNTASSTSSHSTTGSTTITVMTSECNASGFIGDKNDCKKFYRCVENGNGGYERFEFYCSDGTLWDAEVQACNHAWAVSDCRNVVHQKPINNVSETILNQNGNSVEESENSYITENSLTPDNISSTNIQNFTSTTAALNENGKCQTDGFIGDENDCRKFYRCVENGKGEFIIYEFTCGEGTVWDSRITACNHKWSVEKCGSNQGETIDMTSHLPQVSEAHTTQTSEPGPSKTTTQSQISHTSVDVASTVVSTSSDSSDKDQKCTSEGFYSDNNDCTKFFRCVDDGKGGYIKYQFKCGEGTIWVQEIQACDHDTLSNCTSSVSTTEAYKEQTSTTDTPSNTTDTSILTTTHGSKPSASPADSLKCDNEGYFGNTMDCKKFYRCVSNEKGEFTKYDYTCGEGTIWDSDIIACNHPQDVSSPSCISQKENTTEINSNNEYPTTEKITESITNSTTTSSESTSTIKEIENVTQTNSVTPVITTASSTTTEISSSSTPKNNENNQNCQNNTSTQATSTQNVSCKEAGFQSDPYDCKKFYRCVDWDGNGNKFSIYHFECGDGTIWDPSLETCNHEESVIPPRNCSGYQYENMTESTSINQQTTQLSSTQLSSTEQSSTQTSQQSTTQLVSTEQFTTQLSSTDQSTTQTTANTQTTVQSSSTEQSTIRSTSTEPTTIQSSSTEQSTIQSSSTEQSSSTIQLSSTEQSTIQSPSTESSSSTIQSSSTEQFTTLSTTSSVSDNTQSTSTDQITSQSSQEQTTKPSTEQTNSTEESSESTTETTHLTSISTDQTTMENSNTSTDQSTTTDGNISQITEVQSTTESTTESENESSTQPTSSQQQCPETEADQSVFVCPTSFKRHPKYCNLFYQCVEDNDSHEVTLTVFNCPNNTIYDETKIQCVEEKNSKKKCSGKISQKRRVKRLGTTLNEPIFVTTENMACITAGHIPFEIHEECSEAFMKCEATKSGKLRGYVYKCPEDYIYWTISRRCEPKSKVRDCKKSTYPWNKRYDLPIEKYNIAS